MKEFTVPIHVSSIGNDGADGTADHPFATLQRAQIEARSAARKSMSSESFIELLSYDIRECILKKYSASYE